MHFVTNKVGSVRRVRLNGRAVLIAPVVMLTEGVHFGSNGPLFYPSDELSKNVADWHAVPVTLNHPMSNGEAISAKHRPDSIVGVVLNPRWDATAKKLRAEVHIDELRLRGIAPSLLKRIAIGKPVEVSTGLYTEDTVLNGHFNGDQFTAIARNYRPDHLALLPNGIGACSISKGCGITSNQEKEDSMCTCNNYVPTIIGYRNEWGVDVPIYDDPLNPADSIAVNEADELDYSGQGSEHVSDDDEDGDYSPPPTFNAEQYAANQALKNNRRQAPAPVVNRASDDEDDYSPPSTFSRR